METELCSTTLGLIGTCVRENRLQIDSCADWTDSFVRGR